MRTRSLRMSLLQLSRPVAFSRVPEDSDACPMIITTAIALAFQSAAAPDPSPPRSAHELQTMELAADPPPVTEDQLEALRIERMEAARGGSSRRAPGPSAPARVMDDDFVVFGYLQSETQVFHLRWHALTHVGSRFVGFDQNGDLTSTSAFTNRSSYLKAGGAAERAGVKVVLVLANFDDSSNGDIVQVMTTPAKRANLANQLVSLVANDSYAHGVSLDLEFSWGASVRDGISAFCRELRSAMDAVDPTLELSIYTNAIHSSNQWDFDPVTGITPSIDYMLYSMYDWASGSTARAISDFDSCLSSGRMYRYLQDGLPPEKLVPVVSAYSRRWSGVDAYGQSGSSPVSSGFTDARFDTTLRPGLGPAAKRYVRGDEAAWYTYSESGTQRVRTFDSTEALELEVRHTLSAIDPSGQFAGRRLGGIGFWSLLWMAEFSSVDPRTGQAVARTRTYPHIYQLVQDAYARPDEERRYLETFSGLDFRWRDPNESPDTIGDVNLDSSRSHLTVPPAGGVGGGMRFSFDFEGGAANRAVLAHEVLAHPDFPALRDTNAPLGHVRLASRLEVTAVNDVAMPGYAARLVVIDGDGELEASAAFPLDAAGPITLTWDLTDPGQTDAFTTSEPGFSSGDGTLDSNRADADIGVYGVVVEGTGPAAGSLRLDDITYERASPVGEIYSLNEVRYADPSAEFVEIHGPAGPVPFGFEIRVYDPASGAVAASFPLSGQIPDLGRGFGVLAVGDPAVAGVASSVGFADGRDDLGNAGPLAIQLWDAVNAHAHDSLVFESFGGLDELLRVEAERVSDGGGPWLGEIGPGKGVDGQPCSAGRIPDGRRGGLMPNDVTSQMASPGAPNGVPLPVEFDLDFESSPPVAHQTFDAPRRADPTSVGLPASRDGGLALRVLDGAGGGTIAAIGDGWLGRGLGLRVTGELYLPGSTDPTCAVALGVCGGSGSDFFGPDPANSGYESGIWLTWQNNPGVGLTSGRFDHPGAFELVHATHDARDDDPVDVLAVASDLALGVSGGTWVDVEIVVRPEGVSGPDLEVRVNGRDVHVGPLPEGVRRTGALQVGFRENHAGAPSSREGAWVDGLRFEPAVPVIERPAVPR